MAVERRMGKGGVWKYRAYWRSPATGSREVGPWTYDEAEASKLSDQVKFEIKHDRAKFAATKSPDSCTVAVLLLHYIESGCIKPGDRGTKAHLTAMARMLGEKQVCELSPQVIEDLQKIETTTGGIRRSTFRRRLTCLQTAIRWGLDEGLITADPIAGVKVPPGASRKFIPPTPQEIALYISLAPDHVRRILICGFYLGTRIGPSELFKLRWHQFDLDRGVVTFEGARKGRIDDDDSTLRQVAIHSALRPLLQDWSERDRLERIPWLIHWQGRSVKSINKAWQSLKAKAEMHGARAFRPYDLRHAFATYAIAGGASDKVVAELMGLKSTAMVHAHYQHVLNPQKTAAVESLPALPDMESETGYTNRVHSPLGKPGTTVERIGVQKKIIQ